MKPSAASGFRCNPRIGHGLGEGPRKLVSFGVGTPLNESPAILCFRNLRNALLQLPIDIVVRTARGVNLSRCVLLAEEALAADSRGAAPQLTQPATTPALRAPTIAAPAARPKFPLDRLIPRFRPRRACSHRAAVRRRANSKSHWRCSTP